MSQLTFPKGQLHQLCVLRGKTLGQLAEDTGLNPSIVYRINGGGGFTGKTAARINGWLKRNPVLGEIATLVGAASQHGGE